MLSSFPPVVSLASRVLILGTMPGIASLQARQYYAHARNRFWLVMQELTGIPAESPYAERVAALDRAGVALWDVLKHSERSGSPDTNISNEEVNDFADLLERYPRLNVIALNGAKAKQIFERYVLRSLPPAIKDRLTIISLPSTSPASARGGFEKLLDDWMRLKKWL